MLVLEQVCEQASYTLHHVNSVEPFTENLALARLGIASDFWKSWHHQLISFSVTHMHGTIALYHRGIKLCFGLLGDGNRSATVKRGLQSTLQYLIMKYCIHVNV